MLDPRKKNDPYNLTQADKDQLIHFSLPGTRLDSGQVQGLDRYLSGLTSDQLFNRYKRLNELTGGKEGTAGNNRSDLQYNAAYANSKQILGRDPTADEFGQISNYFQDPSDNAKGISTGKQFLYNLKQQYKTNPTLDPTNIQNTKNPADFSSSVNQQFKSILGRDPTADELEHFTTAMKTNQVDAYGLGAFLKQMPEYTNAQDTQFRGGLNTELQNYDTQEFGREKQDVISDYAKRGMAPGSSPSLDYALTDLMGKIAQNRSSYLAQLSSSQYGGNKDLATGNYQNTLNQMYSNNQNQRQQQQNYSNALLDRSNQGTDYNIQKNDFMNYLNSTRGKSGGNPLYGALGGTIGAIGGAFAGGPAGASAGYGIGSGLGNAYGYLNQR